MVTICKGVKAAFARIEAQGAPVDYGMDLARLAQGLAAVGERLGAVERSPLLRQGAEQAARVLERIGRQLTGRLAEARERRNQDRWLLGACGAGVIVGILLMLFVPRVLPGAVSLGTWVRRRRCWKPTAGKPGRR